MTRKTPPGFTRKSFIVQIADHGALRPRRTAVASSECEIPRNKVVSSRVSLASNKWPANGRLALTTETIVGFPRRVPELKLREDLTLGLILSHCRNAYGMYFHIVNLMVYTVFLCFLTLNAVQLMQDNKKRQRGISSLEVANAFARPSIVSEFCRILHLRRPRRTRCSKLLQADKF